MRCDDWIDDKLAVLYGEADAETQRRVAEHAAACPACREELRDLRAVRRDLLAWKLPQTLRPRRPWRRAAAVPSWALPLAATLLVGVAGAWAVARAEQHYASVAQRLSEQEQRHTRELATLRAELDQARAPRAVAASADGELLARVEDLIAASEGRQRAVLRAGFDLMERRRQYDMARVKAGLSYMEGRNGRHMADAMRAVNYVLASQPGTLGAAEEPR
jgi:hypothetical protein